MASPDRRGRMRIAAATGVHHPRCVHGRGPRESALAALPSGLWSGPGPSPAGGHREATFSRTDGAGNARPAGPGRPSRQRPGGVVSARGLEPPRVAPPDPKSGASTGSATPTHERTRHYSSYQDGERSTADRPLPGPRAGEHVLPGLGPGERRGRRHRPAARRGPVPRPGRRPGRARRTLAGDARPQRLRVRQPRAGGGGRSRDLRRRGQRPGVPLPSPRRMGRGPGRALAAAGPAHARPHAPAPELPAPGRAGKEAGAVLGRGLDGGRHRPHRPLRAPPGHPPGPGGLPHPARAPPGPARRRGRVPHPRLGVLLRIGRQQ